jgi:hypothetical protein
MIQLAWRFLKFQQDSALAQWFQTRAADGRGGTRKTMIVALARRLLISLWRLVTTGELSDGIVLRPASNGRALSPLTTGLAAAECKEAHSAPLSMPRTMLG